ncbi:hypothetical protein CD798_09870 [Bacillaceae bacterium SAOS 7]|nr:hypothetical protein CD798_09870 [Bacillaceae bacterium SAOS 7]
MKLKKAVGIIRRSDIKQKENLSFETQESEIHSRAKKEGYYIDGIIKDDANSAYHKVVTKRDAMNDLLLKVLDEHLNIEAVFFYDESRLTRQFYDFTLDIYRKIKEKKPFVKFFSTSQQGEWNPYEITSVIKFANAAQESVQKARRAKDAQNTLLHPVDGSNPKRPGSKTPYGYSKGYDDTLTPDDFSPIVVLIFHLTAWGHSQEKIANFLNAVGIPSPSKKQWSGNTIDYILNNKHYLGHLPWNINSSRISRQKKSEEYTLFFNQHKAIIPVSLWHLAHHTIELHKTFGKNNNSQFVLRDIVFCHKCQGKLSARDNTPAKSKKKYLIYRCPNCKNKISIEALHNSVLNELCSKFSMQLFSGDEQVKELIKKRRKVIISHLKKLQLQSDQIYLNERLLINSESCDYPLQEIDFILAVAKETIKSKIQEANNFIEMIDSLLEDDNLQMIFKNLKHINIAKLQNAELRTLLLSMLKTVQIDFESSSLNIKYRLSPFTQLENFIEKIS